jgi:flagellin-like hook-associated protein FlgL
MMRVTAQSLSTQIIDSLQQAYQRMAQAQEIITSGRQINHLSDDPVGATRTMVLRGFEESLSQYKRNVDQTVPFLQQADAALSNVTDGLNRAKEIALGMANDTNAAADRQSAAVEVHQILLQVLGEANTQVENRSIFGGYLNGKPAFTQGANGINYQGDNGQISIQVNPTSSVNINLLGNEVFQGAGVPGGTGIFDTLQDLEHVLRGESSPNTMNLAVNLDSNLPTGTGFSATNAVGTEATPTTFLGEADFSTNVTVFDSKGQGHDLTFLFAKTGATTFKYRVVANSNEINGGTPGDLYQVAPEGTLEFNADGTLNIGSSTVTDITLSGLTDGAADISVAAANLDFSGSTQRAQPSSVLSQAQSNTNGIQTQIGRLDAALVQISSFRAEVGARLNSAQTASDAVTVMQDHTTAQRSKIEDADVLSAYSEFARLQNAFQAALQSASDVIQPTLLDFLK